MKAQLTLVPLYPTVWLPKSLPVSSSVNISACCPYCSCSKRFSEYFKEAKNGNKNSEMVMLAS